MRSTDHLRAAAERQHGRPPASRGVCERCAGERVAQICSECGAEEQNYTDGRCAACSLHARIEELTERR